jgi:methyl-accepting chemotaxis protein
MSNATETEKKHLYSINKIFSYVLLIHIPLSLILAFIFNTGMIFASIVSVAICSLPLILSFFTSSYRMAAISHGVALMFFSGLMIHLSKGMIEAHFHIFIALAVMIVFANPFVILAAAGTIALHHVGFYFLLPSSVFNYQASFVILLIHAVCVVVQSIPCMWIAEKFRGHMAEQGLFAAQIEDIYQTMNMSMNQLTTNNLQLAKSSDLQSSAVSQTAQTVHQISQMASQTSENAIQSRTISEQTKNSANQGMQIVNQVDASIVKIKESNNSFIDQITENNQQLKEIAQTIKQIESKTNIINDIVFQTKLLSFNASVEAARAGEQGKGFSVVAEEIGKLAATSGLASKDINEIINASTIKVQMLVLETEKKISELISISQTNIIEGEIKVKSCGETFNQLTNYIGELNNRSIEISQASLEQSQGIKEMTTVIQQLENNNLKNHESLKISVDVSEHLSGLSNNLGDLIAKLNSKKAA